AKDSESGLPVACLLRPFFRREWAREGGDPPAACSAPERSKAMRNATSPWLGLAYAQFNERTARIKDSARERHGLFRCGAFGAACVAVHRSNYSGVASPQARIVIQQFDRLFGSAFCEPDPHCLTRSDPFATYRRVTHWPAFTICRCITSAR